MNERIEMQEEVKLPVVGVVMKCLSAEFFKGMQKGVISHVKKRGDLTILALGTQTQMEVGQQVAIVKRLVNRCVDAIVIIPIDSIALVAPLEKADKAGIKIVSVDVMLDQATLARYHLDIPFIGPDNVSAAVMVGDVLAKSLGQGGKIAILEGIPEALNAIQRKEGFLKSINEHRLVLLDSRSAHWETYEARQVFQEMLDSHPDIQGVMCANDAMALGVIQVLQDRNYLDKVKIVGIDNDDSIRKWIEKGVVLATIDLLAKEMAARGIDYAMDAIQGKKISGWIKTPVKLITRDNLTKWVSC